MAEKKVKTLIGLDGMERTPDQEEALKEYQEHYSHPMQVKHF